MTARLARRQRWHGLLVGAVAAAGCAAEAVDGRRCRSRVARPITGTYPNLNIPPQAADDQLSRIETEADMPRSIRRPGQCRAGSSSRTGVTRSGRTAEARRRPTAADTLKEIENNQCRTRTRGLLPRPAKFCVYIAPATSWPTNRIDDGRVSQGPAAAALRVRAGQPAEGQRPLARRRHHRPRHGQSRPADAEGHRRQAVRSGARSAHASLFLLARHSRAAPRPGQLLCAPLRREARTRTRRSWRRSAPRKASPTWRRRSPRRAT